MTLQIDTGADVTVISETTWKAVGGPELSAPDRTLRGPDSSIIATLGKFRGTFARGTQQAVGEIYVAKKLTKSLLGRPTIQDLDLLKTIAAVDHNHPTPRERFPSLFQGLGKFRGEYLPHSTQGRGPALRSLDTTASRSSTSEKSATGTGPDGEDGCDLEGQPTNRVVRRNGRRSQVQWQSSDMCRPDTAQYECEERETSSPGR